MWANAQRDGRPAEHTWRPLFNAAKYALRGVEQRSPPVFGRATISLGIGPHSSSYFVSFVSDIAMFVLKRDVKLQLNN